MPLNHGEWPAKKFHEDEAPPFKVLKRDAPLSMLSAYFVAKLRQQSMLTS